MSLLDRYGSTLQGIFFEVSGSFFLSISLPSKDPQSKKYPTPKFSTFLFETKILGGWSTSPLNNMLLEAFGGVAAFTYLHRFSRSTSTFYTRSWSTYLQHWSLFWSLSFDDDTNYHFDFFFLFSSLLTPTLSFSVSVSFSPCLFLF